MRTGESVGCTQTDIRAIAMAATNAGTSHNRKALVLVVMTMVSS
jgi:hypothetical protein